MLCFLKKIFLYKYVPIPSTKHEVYIQHAPSRRTEGTLGRGGETRFVRVRAVGAGKLRGELRPFRAEIPGGTQRRVRRRGLAVVASGADVAVRRSGVVLISTGHAVDRVRRSRRAVVPPCARPIVDKRCACVGFKFCFVVRCRRVRYDCYVGLLVLFEHQPYGPCTRGHPTDDFFFFSFPGHPTL